MIAALRLRHTHTYSLTLECVPAHAQTTRHTCKRGTRRAHKPPAHECSHHARGGKRKDVLDIFGTWVPMEDCSAGALRERSLPCPLVDSSDVLEFNFEWSSNNTLPYELLDSLRLKHAIDVTGLNVSLTRGDKNYRSYVLTRGNVA